MQILQSNYAFDWQTIVIAKMIRQHTFFKNLYANFNSSNVYKYCWILKSFHSLLVGETLVLYKDILVIVFTMRFCWTLILVDI